MDFSDYLGNGPKWSLLDGGLGHLILTHGLDPFCGWGFLEHSLWVKVFGANSVYSPTLSMLKFLCYDSNIPHGLSISLIVYLLALGHPFLVSQFSRVSYTHEFVTFGIRANQVIGHSSLSIGSNKLQLCGWISEGAT